MKNKKVLIGCGICLLVIVLVAVLVLVLGNGKDKKEDIDKVVSTVLLEINPSIEVGLNKKQEVVEVKALNDDAKDIIAGNFKGKSWEDALKGITEKLIEHGYVEEDNVVILMNVTGEAKGEELENGIRHVLGEKNINSDVIVIDNISEEDKELAKQYNISPVKASFINTVVKENEKVSFESLIERPVRELKETKETGRFCDEGWALEGEFCVREKSRVPAVESSVCPEDSEEVNGKCYKKGKTDQEAYCKDEKLRLENNKCVGVEKVDAKATCSSGKFNSKTGKCELATYVSEGTKSCNEEIDLLLDNGKCASAHPGAHSYGDNDAPFDEATECCCGDTFRNGWCYSLPNGNYDAKVSCPSGSTAMTGDKGLGCYKVESSEPNYTCDKGTVEGTKCNVEVSKNPDHKASCREGLTLHEDRVCLDMNTPVEKKTGYACKDKNAKLVDDQCVIYESIEANQ